MDHAIDLPTAVQMIGEIERRTSAPRVVLFIREQGSEVEQSFNHMRLELASKRAVLANVVYSDIRAQFERLDEDLRAGIDNLKREIDRLARASKLIEGLGHILGILARILAG